MPTAVHRTPWHVWLAAGLAALLRGLPFLWTRLAAPPPDTAWLPMGFVSKDWLAYVALIGQPLDSALPAFANPFTTDAQAGRFLLLFHALLGAVHRVTGLDPFWLLELSRVPLLLAFFAVLWRLLAVILPGERERTWACWLVAFSGGVEFLLAAVADWLPPSMSETVRQDLWPLYGWSTFQAFYNPLWIAGLTLLMVVLRPALRPGGPRGWRDVLTIGVGLVTLWFVHSYSAIAAVAVVGTTLLLEALLGPGAEPSRPAAVLMPLGLAILSIGAVTAWQLQDEVYRRSTGGVFGAQGAPTFWYPLTLGAVGIFALLGWRRWLEERRPWRFALGGWTLAVALLHTSTVLNGYHFLMYLHLPVCLVAASALAAWQDRLAGDPPRRVRLMAIGALLFASAGWVTLASLVEVQRAQVPSDVARLLRALSSAPAGNALAPPDLGAFVPAYGPHRVFVGHWFMTPDYEARARLYRELTEDPEASGAALLELVERQRIGYLVAPAATASRVAAVLGERVERTEAFGAFVLLRLRPRRDLPA